MTTADQGKATARRLRASLATHDLAVPHATALELVAASLGHEDWNTACAALERTADDGIRFLEATPILRIFDEAKAREFYYGFLGFAPGFEHRFEPGLPLYMEVARAGLRLHLSEHQGDASPGSTVFVQTRDVHAFHRELTDRRYGHARPGIERAPWGDVWSGGQLLFHLIGKLYETASIVVTTNLAFGEWPPCVEADLVPDEHRVVEGDRVDRDGGAAPLERRAAMLPAARSIWAISQPPKMSPAGFASAGIATVRMTGAPRSVGCADPLPTSMSVTCSLALTRPTGTSGRGAFLPAETR